MSEPDHVIAGRYRLLDQVGRGGMGAVWRARDELLERDVAVKQLHVEPEPLAPEKREVRHQRAMREARITARLHHQHAVPVFDAVEHEGRPFLIMQYFPSRSLQEVLAEHGTLPAAVVARIGAEVASALAAAHSVGVIHRDVKPGNVLLAGDGTSKITDFGIAHVVGDITLTSRGVITGTPAYLAPEVARGERSSEASDVFSLGATVYRALEGHPPFPPQENQLALLHRVGSGVITPPERAGELTPLLLRMLAPDPSARPSMDEVASLLREPPGGVAAAVPPPPAVLPRSETDPARPGGGAEQGTEQEGTEQKGTEQEGDTTTLTLTLGRTAALPAAAPEGAAADTVASASAEPGETPDGGGDDRRWGRALAVLALAVTLAAVILLVDRRSPPDEASVPDQPSASAPTSSSTSPPTSAQTSAPAGSGPAATAVATAPPASDATTAVPGGAASSPPSAAAPTTAAPTSAPAAIVGPGPGPGSTARQAEEAIRRYYQLLPADTDAGWALLTERYRRTTARNRATYDAFWRSIEQVSVTDTEGSASGSVTATITYAFTDGRTFVERTSYQLVSEDAVLKIDRSTVLSSSQR